MHDDDMDELLRVARRAHHAPPEPPLDRMWARVEERAFRAPAHARARRTHPVRSGAVAWWVALSGVAAALLLGVGIGRMTAGPGGLAAGSAATRAVADRGADLLDAPYTRATTEYLGATAALLSALPVAARGDVASDARVVAQAGELLTTTRLLIDSPAGADPRLRTLLEDLELVLAQIARLPARRDSTELDLIRMALEQRDVVPRLRSAAADMAASAGD